MSARPALLAEMATLLRSSNTSLRVVAVVGFRNLLHTAQVHAPNKKTTLAPNICLG